MGKELWDEEPLGGSKWTAVKLLFGGILACGAGSSRKKKRRQYLQKDGLLRTSHQVDGWVKWWMARQLWERLRQDGTWFNKDHGASSKFIHLQELGGWSFCWCLSVMKNGPKVPMIPSDKMMQLQDQNDKPSSLCLHSQTRDRNPFYVNPL